MRMTLEPHQKFPVAEPWAVTLRQFISAGTRPQSLRHTWLSTPQGFLLLSTTLLQILLNKDAPNAGRLLACVLGSDSETDGKK